MDEIVQHLVDRTIADTKKLVEREGVPWSVARRGVLLMVRELTREHPHCEGDIKEAFEKFIVNQDRESNLSSAVGVEVIIVEQSQSDGNNAKVHARRHERIFPRGLKGPVELEGKTYAAKILNVSKSGIGLEADVKPPIGSTIVIGDAFVTVIRHFDCGYAGKFLNAVDPEEFVAALRSGNL